MRLSKAIEGYLLDRLASGYSPKTVRLYRLYLPILCNFLGDPEVHKIELADLQRYMVYLKTQYVPKRRGDDDDNRPLSESAIDNHWKAIRSFFGWAKDVLKVRRPDDLPPI